MNLYITERMNEIQKKFDEIAENVFNNYHIIREKEEYELAEIEIYYKDKDIDDIFRHQTKEHLKNNYIYNHYSGFDICLGNDSEKIYCGILVRGIRKDSEVIFGPRKVRYKGRKKELRDIKIIKLDTSIDNFKIDSKDLNNKIFKLPRVNLSNSTSFKFLNKDTDSLALFLNIKARYIVLKKEDFFTLSKEAPAEPREIFNALIEFKKS